MKVEIWCFLCNLNIENVQSGSNISSVVVVMLFSEVLIFFSIKKATKPVFSSPPFLFSLFFFAPFAIEKFENECWSRLSSPLNYVAQRDTKE